MGFIKKKRKKQQKQANSFFLQKKQPLNQLQNTEPHMTDKQQFKI